MRKENPSSGMNAHIEGGSERVAGENVWPPPLFTFFTERAGHQMAQ